MASFPARSKLTPIHRQIDNQAKSEPKSRKIVFESHLFSWNPFSSVTEPVNFTVFDGIRDQKFLGQRIGKRSPQTYEMCKKLLRLVQELQFRVRVTSNALLYCHTHKT